MFRVYVEPDSGGYQQVCGSDVFSHFLLARLGIPLLENCVASIMVPDQEVAEVQNGLGQYLTRLVDCGTGR